MNQTMNSNESGVEQTGTLRGFPQNLCNSAFGIDGSKPSIECKWQRGVLEFFGVEHDHPLGPFTPMSEFAGYTYLWHTW